jgi:hypothetical protein
MKLAISVAPMPKPTFGLITSLAHESLRSQEGSL